MTDPPRVQLRCPDPLRPAVTAALAAAALPIAAPGNATVEVGLLVADGRPHPALADDWLVDSLPHLALVVTPTVLRIGPFVVPGTTACLRCLEAARQEEHAARLVSATPSAATGGGSPGADRVLLGSALAATEVTRWLGGRLPRTCSATLHVDADLATWHRRWPRHPWCGCGWGEDLMRA